MHEVEAHRISFPASDLATLPDDQLTFVLNASRAANDIISAQRLVIAFENGQKSDTDKNERDAQSLFWFDALGHLAAKSWEAWLVLKDSSRLWGSNADLDISANGRQRLDNIKARFSNGSPLSSIRNEYSFHCGKAHQLRAQKAIIQDWAEKGESIELIAGERHLHTLFLFAGQTAAFAMLDRAFPGLERHAQMTRLHDAVVEAASDLQTFLPEVITLLLERSDSSLLSSPNMSQVSKHGRPLLDDLRLPFFVRVPK